MGDTEGRVACLACLLEICLVKLDEPVCTDINNVKSSVRRNNVFRMLAAEPVNYPLGIGWQRICNHRESLKPCSFESFSYWFSIRRRPTNKMQRDIARKLRQ